MNHTRSPHISRRGSEGICSQSAFIGWLEELLKLVFAPTAQQPPKRGRPLSLTEPHVWLCILVGVLHGAHSFQAFWRLLVVEPLGSFPLLSITDAAVRKRLLALGQSACAQLYRRLCDVLPSPPISQTTLSLACFAAEVVSLDESTLETLARAPAELRSLEPLDPQLTSRQVGRVVGCAKASLAASAVARRCSGRLFPRSGAVVARPASRQPDPGRPGLLWLSLVGSVKSTRLVVRLAAAGEWLLRHPPCREPKTLLVTCWMP
jgi:hypothetical protein